jgi:hypothetical protein
MSRPTFVRPYAGAAPASLGRIAERARPGAGSGVRLPRGWLAVAGVAAFGIVIALSTEWHATQARRADGVVAPPARSVATTAQMGPATERSQREIASNDAAVRDAASTWLRGRQRGYDAIKALQDGGQFAEAAGFALRGGEEFRRDWLIAAYFAWAAHEPSSALDAAIKITVPTEREIALQSVWSGWANADPASMAETALRFPEGAEQAAALTKALRAWMQRDPDAAGDWILAHERAIAVAENLFRADRR